MLCRLRKFHFYDNLMLLEKKDHTCHYSFLKSHNHHSRSRPVVRVNADVQLELGDGVNTVGGAVIIDSENRTCKLASGIRVACLTVRGCLLYEGEAVDDELGTLMNYILIR